MVARGYGQRCYEGTNGGYPLCQHFAGAPPAPAAPPPLAGLRAGAWHFLHAAPWNGSAPFRGQLRGEIGCGDGESDFYFGVHRGSASDVMVWFQGGGVCDDYSTCFGGQPECTLGADIRAFFEAMDFEGWRPPGVLDHTSALNPFAGWTQVLVPYCTCDAHLGRDRVRFEGGRAADRATMAYAGGNNTRWVLDWVLAELQGADHVVVGGASAGGIGALHWAPVIFDGFPQARHAYYGDSFWVPAAGALKLPFALHPDLRRGDAGTNLSLPARLDVLAQEHPAAMLAMSSYASDDKLEQQSFLAGDCFAELDFEDGLRDSLAGLRRSHGERFTYFLASGSGHMVNDYAVKRGPLGAMVADGQEGFPAVEAGGRNLSSWLASAVANATADAVSPRTMPSARLGNARIADLKARGLPRECSGGGTNETFLGHAAAVLARLIGDELRALDEESHTKVLQKRASARHAALRGVLPEWLGLNMEVLTILYTLFITLGSGRGLVQGLDRVFLEAFRVHRVLNWGNSWRHEGYSEAEVERTYWNHWDTLGVLDVSRPIMRRDRARYCRYIEAEWQHLQRETVQLWGSRLPALTALGEPDLMYRGCMADGLVGYSVVNDWEWHLRDAKASLATSYGDLVTLHTTIHWLSLLRVWSSSNGYGDAEELFDLLYASFELFSELDPAAHGAGASASQALAGNPLTLVSRIILVAAMAVGLLSLAVVLYAHMFLGCPKAFPVPEAQLGSIRKYPTIGLRVRSLRVSYKSYTVAFADNVEVSAQSGEIIGLLGPSGAGKTSMLEWLTGYRVNDFTEAYGTVTVSTGGSDVALDSAAERSERFSLLQQHEVNEEFYKHFIVRDALWAAAACESPTLSHKQRLDAVSYAFSKSGLPERALSLRVRQLSGGQKRMLQVAIRIATGRQILVLDEPTSGLDASTALNLTHSLRSIARGLNIIVIAAVHQPSTEMSRLFDRLMMLLPSPAAAGRSPGGVMVCCGTVEDVLVKAQQIRGDRELIQTLLAEVSRAGEEPRRSSRRSSFSQMVSLRRSRASRASRAGDGQGRSRLPFRAFYAGLVRDLLWEQAHVAGLFSVYLVVVVSTVVVGLMAFGRRSPLGGSVALGICFVSSGLWVVVAQLYRSPRWYAVFMDAVLRGGGVEFTHVVTELMVLIVPVLARIAVTSVLAQLLAAGLILLRWPTFWEISITNLGAVWSFMFLLPMLVLSRDKVNATVLNPVVFGVNGIFTGLVIPFGVMSFTWLRSARVGIPPWWGYHCYMIQALPGHSWECGADGQPACGMPSAETYLKSAELDDPDACQVAVPLLAGTGMGLFVLGACILIWHAVTAKTPKSPPRDHDATDGLSLDAAECEDGSGSNAADWDTLKSI